MKFNKIIIIILFIILFLIVYNLYKNDKLHNDINIEHFSVLNKLNKKKKKSNFINTNTNNNNNNNTNKNLNSNKYLNSLKSNKSGITFEDLLKASEKLNTKKISFENIGEQISKYNNSFYKEKFKNNSKNTSESFEKFSLYKEKFFEIFK
jgi:hypothetical protein